MLLTKIVLLIAQGEQWPTQEATTLFFGISKLFQNKDASLRQMYVALPMIFFLSLYTGTDIEKGAPRGQGIGAFGGRYYNVNIYDYEGHWWWRGCGFQTKRYTGSCQNH